MLFEICMNFYRFSSALGSVVVANLNITRKSNLRPYLIFSHVVRREEREKLISSENRTEEIYNFLFYVELKIKEVI